MNKDIVAKRYKIALENQRAKFERFNEFDYIYHSELKHFDPNTPSKVFNPIAWSFVETIVTRLLSKNPIINYMPREPGDEEQAKINTQLFDYWFDKAQAYPKMVAWVKDSLIYGTGIIKMDWYSCKPREVKSYVYDQMGEAIVGEDGALQTEDKGAVTDYDDPRLTNVNIYDFFIDPMAQSIEDAKWVIHQYWADIKDLENQNDAAGNYDKVLYNKAALRRLKGTNSSSSESQYERDRKGAAGFNDISKDTTVSKVKIWEMWENNRVTIVANETEVLRDSDNPYWHGKKPFVRLVDSIVPLEFYGKGEIEPIEKQVHALNTTQNQRITNVNRILSPVWWATSNVEDEELQFIDNGIVHVNQPTDAGIFTMPNVTGTAIQEQQVLMESMQRALGVTDYVQGLSTPGQTAAEVQTKTAQANARFAHKVKIFEEMGLKPLGELVYQLYQQFITTAKIIRITGKEGEQYVRISPQDMAGEYDVIPESESTLEVDQGQEFQKYINLLQLLQPYFVNTQPDPMTGQMMQTGFINKEEFIKELLIKSGIKDPERFYANRNVPGQVQPDAQGTPGAIPGDPNQGYSGGQGLQPTDQPPGMDALSQLLQANG